MARRPTAWQSGTNGGGHENRWWQPDAQTDESRQKLKDRASEASLYLPADAMQGQNEGRSRADRQSATPVPLCVLVAWSRIEGDMNIASYRIKSCIVGRVKVAASMRWRLVFVSWIGRLSRRVVKTLRSHGTGQDRRRQASPRREQRKSQTGSRGGMRCDQDSRPGLEASGPWRCVGANRAVCSSM